mgnify:CR=1 FL=1
MTKAAGAAAATTEGVGIHEWRDKTITNSINSPRH